MGLAGHELAEQRRQYVARALRMIDQRGILRHIHRAGTGHPLFGQADLDLQMADVANSDLAMSSYVDPAMRADSEITFRTTAVAYGAEALAELVMTDHYIGSCRSTTWLSVLKKVPCVL
ncbi:MAG: hypothetical protein CMM46_07485 [Rhodospirillaceae bacterium]|nr:hypothetical protein [Rhodospirillaceae bacterium]|tara:strand:+ start:3923 stop:4279 length:357 start_codon:yes stop_codon:yes gene_type:complete